jgi:hypothetical protein
LIGASDGRVPGLLPGAELIAVDAFQRFGKSADIANIYDLVRALDLLVKGDVNVVNLSLTGPNAKPVYPAAYDDVIAVTAVDKGRHPYRVPCVATMLTLPLLAGVWTAASVSGARQKTGTFFAAPFVTAAVSVLIAGESDMSLESLEAKISQFTDDIGKPGRDPVFGWWLLNASRLCEAGSGITPSALYVLASIAISAGRNMCHLAMPRRGVPVLSFLIATGVRLRRGGAGWTGPRPPSQSQGFAGLGSGGGGRHCRC